MKYPKSVMEMKNAIGNLYEVKNIDFETCLYRNFKNGFDVEISGVNSRKKKKNREIIIWLWWIGRRQNQLNSGTKIIRHVANIPWDASAVHAVTELLREYSERILADGYNANDIVEIEHDRYDYEDFISGGGYVQPKTLD